MMMHRTAFLWPGSIRPRSGSATRMVVGALLLTLGILGTSPASARELAAETKILHHDSLGVPSFVRGSLDSLDLSRPLEEEAATFLHGFVLEHLGASGGETFTFLGAGADELGLSHLRFQQQIHGLEVVGAEMIVHVDRATGEVICVNGRFAPDRDLPEVAELSSAEALQRASRAAGLPAGSMSEPELVYVQGTDARWHLAWRGRHTDSSLGEGGTESASDEIFAAAADGSLVARHGRRFGSQWIDHGESGALGLAFADLLGSEPRLAAAGSEDRRQDLSTASRALFLLAEGDGKTAGLSIEDAAEVLHRALNVYLFPSADFADARVATIQAAVDLFGVDSHQEKTTAAVWDAVGVEAKGGFPAPPSPFYVFSCSGLECTFDGFAATFPSGTPIVFYQWSFPGGNFPIGPRTRFFFPGYGTYSVSLSVTDGNGLQGFTTQQVLVQPQGTIDPRVGNWYNPQRNGNGLDVLRTPDGRFGLGWYTYLSNGTPIWYTSSVAAKSAATWSASLRKSTWNGTSATSTVVGSVQLDFSSSTEAWFSWTLNGQSGGERVEFLFGGLGRSGAWFVPSEPGWGLQTQEQSGVLGGAVTFFEGSQPRWVSGSGSASSDTTVALRWRTGLGLCPSCSGGSTAPPPSQPAGSFRLQVASGSSTTGTLTTSITTPGGSTWNRGPVAIQLLTDP